MATITIHKPGHYVFGLRTHFTPGSTAPVGTYTVAKRPEDFANSHDQGLILSGVLSVDYADKPAVVAPKPVEAAKPAPVVEAPKPIEEPVVIEDIETPVVVQVTAPKAAPKGK